MGCLSHSPGSISHGRYLYSWNSVGAEKGGCLETYRRELSEHVSFGDDTLMAFNKSSLENSPRGVLYSPLYMDSGVQIGGVSEKCYPVCKGMDDMGAAGHDACMYYCRV